MWLAAAIDFGWNRQPPARRTAIPVNATVPAVPAGDVGAVLARFPGCRTAKVKVAERGQVLADDVARVRAVRDALGPEGRIRIDANGAWNVDEAEHALHDLSPSTSSTPSSPARASPNWPNCDAGSATGTSRSPPTRACGRHPTRSPSRARARPTSS